MNIEQLRKLAGREEIDYPFLMSALSNYAWPREKISNWLKSGELIRVKKGYMSLVLMWRGVLILKSCWLI